MRPRAGGLDQEAAPGDLPRPLSRRVRGPSGGTRRACEPRSLRARLVRSARTSQACPDGLDDRRPTATRIADPSSNCRRSTRARAGFRISTTTDRPTRRPNFRPRRLVSPSPFSHRAWLSHTHTHTHTHPHSSSSPPARARDDRRRALRGAADALPPPDQARSDERRVGANRARARARGGRTPRAPGMVRDARGRGGRAGRRPRRAGARRVAAAAPSTSRRTIGRSNRRLP